HHALLMANCLAQSEALMRGRTLDEARARIADRFEGAELERQAAHRVFDGNRPSTTLVYETLDPFTLGQIIALYEHRTYLAGVLWQINSFDQWGVERGKTMATRLKPALRGETTAQDVATQKLISQL
ncbi:MAG: glucose-6-phosphate isomerase, partial [Pseudomonadota bacterium]